jgi:hypothetical protein
MRNIAIVFTLVAVLVALGAGVALAGDQVIQCKKKPCTTTGNFDKVLERVGNRVPDEIIDKGGDDLILANKYTRDKDVVTGGSGDDKINVADGDKKDKASGGPNRDWCIVDARSELGGGCTKVTVK